MEVVRAINQIALCWNALRSLLMRVCKVGEVEEGRSPAAEEATSNNRARNREYLLALSLPTPINLLFVLFQLLSSPSSRRHDLH